MEKKKRAQVTETCDFLPDSHAVLSPLELFRVLSILRLFYFILIFNVRPREAEEVGEEELVGSPEDSMGCHLNPFSVSHC